MRGKRSFLRLLMGVLLDLAEFNFNIKAKFIILNQPIKTNKKGMMIFQHKKLSQLTIHQSAYYLSKV